MEATRPKRLEFYFDVVCPFAYLASTRVEEIARRNDAVVVYHPVLLGGILSATSRDPWFTVKLPEAKKRHTVADALRYAEIGGVDFSWNPLHPVRTLLAMRCLMLIEVTPAVIDALYRSYWVEGNDLSQPEVVADCLSSVGLDGPAIVERANSTEVKSRLREVTDAAVSRGVFGVPTMFVDDQIFYGQDRLDFVETQLREGTP